MSAIALFLMILMQLQLPLFLVALAGSLGGQYMLRSGKLRNAKIAVAVGFGAASLLAVMYMGVVILSLRGGGGIGLNAIMAALWTFFAWRDYKMLQMLKGR